MKIVNSILGAGKTNFLLLIVFILFSCPHDDSSVTPTAITPIATATLSSVDYGGDFYIILTNANVSLRQKTDFGSQANFYINPSLPRGLTLDLTRGHIIGTPTALSFLTKYTVTATADSKDYTIKVIFLGVAPSQVWVTNTNSAKPYELTAYVVGDRSKQAGVSWSSSDMSLATVNNRGVVDIKTSPIGGDVDIIATATDGNTGKTIFNVPRVPIDYGTSDFYIALVNNQIDLAQNSRFSSATFSVVPLLPNGVSLDTTSGDISGTPTALMLPSEYAVIVTEGSRSQTNMVSLGVAPSQVWVTNTNSAKPYELTAYVVGDRTKQAGVSWSSSDTSLATVNNRGVVDIKTSPIGGDVDIIATATDGNTGRITFDVSGTSINYGTSDFYIALVNNQIDLAQNSRFSSATFSVAPALPNGLSLDTTSGDISGTPTVVMLPKEYTVTATEGGKRQIKKITLGVAPSQVWVTNADSSRSYDLTAYVVGDRTKQVGISWSSSDTSLATVNNNGVVDIKTSPIGGNVDIIATTTDGNTGKVTFNIFSAYIDYGTRDYYVARLNTQVDLVQSSTFNSTVFSVAPALPNGLTIDAASGSISGIPTVVMLPSEYTVTATAGGRSQTKVISLGVAPSEVWVTNVDPTKIYDLTVYVVGDRNQQTGISWSSSDTSLATVNSNGVVNLKTSPVGGAVDIIATKGGNTDKVTFNVSSDSLGYGTSDYYIVRINNQVSLDQNIVFENTVFSVNPALPNGLTLDTANGGISGIPTVVMLPSEYTITARASGRSQIKKITLGVSPSQVWVTNIDPSRLYDLTAYVVGDDTKQTGTSWRSSDLYLATVNNNGVVSLKVSSVGGDVDIIAIAADGNTGKITLSVPSIPISYGLKEFYIARVNNQANLIQSSAFTGTVFSITPALPNGLSIDTTSGDISGTPTVTVPIKKYTVIATARGRSQTKQITLGVSPSEVWVTSVSPSNPYELAAYVEGDSSQQLQGWTWNSSDTSLATVNNNGVVSFVPTSTGGTVEITATKNSYSQKVSFTVSEYTSSRQSPMAVSKQGDVKILKEGGKVHAVIGNGVTAIEERQFIATSGGGVLNSVEIPDSVIFISNSAFEYNELSSVEIPDSVTYIGDSAFRDNQLVSVVIGNNVTYLGDSVFRDNQLSSIVIPNNVINISMRAFFGNQLVSVVIGNSVTTIGGQAFYNNQLRSVVIPNSVKTIGDLAFRDNQLVSVVIGNSVTTIGQQAFYYNTELASVVIGDSVTTIGADAFNFNKLTSVVIPDSVTTIGAGAFSRGGIKKVSLKQSLYDSLGSSGRGSVFGGQVTNYVIRP